MLDRGAQHHPIADRLTRELDEVALVFERQLASELSAVNTLCLHVEQYRGKMLRPSLVLLSGLAAGELTQAHRIVAAVTEMIHMATLVHDDVLDEADVRRRGATINHLWGNEAAVMLGDYLISNAFHLCSTIGDPAINLALGEITNTLCEGELLQLHHRNDTAIDVATYFEIIRRKTASLIGACCELGARIAGADETVSATMRDVGIGLGMAFQIQDDLLDLVGDQSVVGKPLGRDLEKGKLTLPMIYGLAETSGSDRGDLLALLDSGDHNALRLRLLRADAVESARHTAEQFVHDAREALALLAPSAARDLFDELARTIVSRDR